MRMHSLRESIPQTIITWHVVKLSTWLSGIDVLRSVYGDDMVLYFESDSFVLFRIAPSLIPNFVEQYYIEDNAEMTLKQWKETLENIVDLFNADYYVYLVSNTDFNIRLSNIK